MESLIGKTIDNYLILEVIGRGGMGVVLKALDTSLDKIVALKMIDPFLARDENFVRRFKTEAKALARLENTNIVSVYALRETESGFFMVMEYVPAKPLSYFLQEKGSINPNPFGLKDTLSITKQLLHAIGHAHSVGVIHRDIKPSNILLCDNGKIKVTDFGLAKVIQQKGPTSTVTQTRAGTLYYMSPEQVKGLKNVDKRSDLYSLGMTVYEMLTGRVPFEKTDSDYTIQKKIVEGEIPSPIKLNANIPKKLTKIISKSIDKDPDKRYQNAMEMLNDIEKFEKEFIDEKNENENEAKIKLNHLKGMKSEIDEESKINYKSDFKFLKNSAIIIFFVTLIAILIIIYFLISNRSQTYLSVKTIPPDATVLINNIDAGKSPIEDFEIEKEGKVKIKITKAGFIGIDTSIVLLSGQSENLSLSLTSIPNEKLTINTIPVDAKIYIDGNRVGNTPLENYLLSQGSHHIKITKVGFSDVDTILTVNQNSEKIINLKLMNDPEFKGFGSLVVNSIPSNADVLLNEEAVGKTKYVNKEIPLGDYELIIRKDGYEDYKESFSIVRHKSKTINKALTKKADKIVFGNLEVVTNPDDADIYLNGMRQDKSNFKAKNLPVGKYTLEIKKKGFLNVKETIIINPDKLTSISRNLVALGNLSINSEPSNAEILINNKSYGKTPNNNLQLPFGVYTVEIKKTGYRTYSENIKITDNKTPYNINPKLELVMGKVEILVRPYGDIYINGKLEKKEAMTRFLIPLPGGNHTIKIVHPTLKGVDKVITIVDEEPQNFVFDLSRVVKLTITSTPSNCEIFLDEQQLSNNTPSRINLKPGNYKIKVKKEGYKPLEQTYNVGFDLYEESKDREDNLDFPLDKI